MLLISYDISDDKLRTKFSNFLKKYGYRLQYSVFEIKNSPKYLENIQSQIATNFSKHFSQRDNVMIFHMSKTCKIKKYGYVNNHEEDLVIVD